jgi:hypothetical protein
MKSDKNTDQLDKLIESLQNHEEPYTEGAWERFVLSQKKKKRIIPLWFYPGLAAGLVAIFSFVFLFNSPDPKPTLNEIAISDEATPPIQENIVVPQIESETKNEQLAADLKGNTSAERAVGLQKQSKHEQSRMAIPDPNNLLDAVVIAQSSAADKGMENKLTNTEVLIELAELESRVSEALADHSLFSTDVQINKIALNENIKLELPFDNLDDEKEASGSDKWAFDVLLSSNVALAGDASRLNLGAGFVSDYKLNKRLSLTGGISLNQFSADNYNEGRSRRAASDAPQNHPNPEAPGAVFSSVVSTVTSQLLGIEMPIGIKMNISEGIYAQTGISPVGMIRERTESVFMVESFTPSWSNDPSGNPQFSMVRNAYSARTNNSYNTFEQVNFAAFYNLSFGYTSKIGNRNRLSFEPYLRLPLGSLNSRESSWSVSGLNLKFGF